MQLFTTWLVLTEVGHLLSSDVRMQLGFLDWLSVGGARLVDLEAIDLQRLRELTEKYGDVPMDFADGSLIVASDKLGERMILTFDSDFYVYRAARGEAFEFVLPVSK